MNVSRLYFLLGKVYFFRIQQGNVPVRSYNCKFKRWNFLAVCH